MADKAIEIAGFYFALMPTRGTHLRARTRPVSVIFAPDTSLTWPGGQLPSSTLMRWPSFRSGMSCSRPYVVACALCTHPGARQPNAIRKQNALNGRRWSKISYEKEILRFIGEFRFEVALNAPSLLRRR